jgi:hypothetical protein
MLFFILQNFAQFLQQASETLAEKELYRRTPAF